jgi:hypothetical protein
MRFSYLEHNSIDVEWTPVCSKSLGVLLQAALAFQAVPPQTVVEGRPTPRRSRDDSHESFFILCCSVAVPHALLAVRAPERQLLVLVLSAAALKISTPML